MLANYHTHTFRCHHASGTEEEYIQRALEAGVSVMGFSDHSPYPMENGHCAGFRMSLSDTENYVETLLNLREKYKGRIDIYIGFEAEYYPKYFNGLLEFLEPFPYDYLIMGQHILGNEIDEGAYPCTAETKDETILARYVSQVCEGIRTGAFSYIAHPDVFHYVGSEQIYKAHMKELCLCAKEHDVPLEMNGLGIRTSRFYPTPLFWDVVEEVGNDVVYGCDAHDAPNAWDEPSYQTTREICKKRGLRLLETVKLVRPHPLA